MLSASINSRLWRFTRKRRATTLDGTGTTAVWAACGKSDKLGTCLNLKFSSSVLRWFVSEAPQPPVIEDGVLDTSGGLWVSCTPRGPRNPVYHMLRLWERRTFSTTGMTLAVQQY